MSTNSIVSRTEAIIAQNKQYREDNKEAILAQNKQYYEDNKEAIIVKRKQYYEDNKEAILVKRTQYYEDNKEAIIAQNKQYREDNKEAIIVKRTQYYEDSRGSNGITIRGSEAHRIKLSCGQQGCTLDEWDGFAVESPYCPKFNEACKERNREKYDRRCFICNKTEAENGGRKLSVHHVDMNKSQGCDGHIWQLVPLCARHHSKAHNETVQARLEYLLKHVWVI